MYCTNCISDTLPSTLRVGRVEEPSTVHLRASANCIFYTLPSLERMGSAGSVLLTKYCHTACFDLWPNQDTNAMPKVVGITMVL